MSSNRYGVDVSYFKKWFDRAFKDLSNYKPDELARELARMSRTADDTVLLESEFAGATIAQQAQELEAKDARIAELNVEVLALSGKDLSTALKLARRIDEIVEAGNGLIYNDSGTAPLYQPAVDKWNKALSNTKGEG